MQDIMEHANRLISSLSRECASAILSQARTVTLPHREALYLADQEMQSVFFLTSGAASVVVAADDGGTAEIDMIGREGLVGGSQLLGREKPVSGGFMQVSGAGLRVPIAEMRRLVNEVPEIRLRVMQAVLQQTLSISQIAGCNRLHSAEERLSRWLLTASDRAGSLQLDLTQEFLSEMLGTRRTTVALVAGALQRSGMIELRRGQVSIIDRDALRSAACGCYEVTRGLVDRLYQ